MKGLILAITSGYSNTKIIKSKKIPGECGIYIETGNEKLNLTLTMDNSFLTMDYRQWTMDQKRSMVNGQWSLVKKIICHLSLFFLLFTIHYSLFTGFSYAGIITSDLKNRLTILSADEKITVIVWIKESKELQLVPQTIPDRAQAVLKAQSIAAKLHAPLAGFLEKRLKENRCEHYLSFWLFNALSVTADKETVEEISQRSEVKMIIPNYTYTLPSQPTPDPSLKALANQQGSPWGVTKIRADKVRDNVKFSGISITGGDENNKILIGHLDTGTTSEHLDLQGKIEKAATFNDKGKKTSDTAVEDNPDAHGTHTSGIIVGGNASGEYIGVAPGAKLLVAKVVVASSAELAQVMGGAQWCYEEGAKIINFSLGTDKAVADTTWVPQIEQLIGWGMLPIISIGNQGGKESPPNTTSPGNVPSAFGVGSTNNDDSISSFSSQGPVTWTQDTYNTKYSGTYPKPDLTAPGNTIMSSSTKDAHTTTEKSFKRNNNYYFNLSGTSQAAPHVSGTAALVLQALNIQNQTLTVDQLKSLLESAVVDLGTSGKDNTFGAGRIDAFYAVSKADLTPPTVTHTQVHTAEANTDINLTAEVTDNVAVSDSSLATTPSVKIWYRVTGASTFTSITMTNTTGNTYSGTIPKSSVIPGRIEYYILAEDLKPNSVSSPSSGYYYIGVNDTTEPKVTSQSVIPNDYISSTSTISFTLTDENGSGVNPSTISLAIKDESSGSTLGTYTTSSTPAINFNAATGVLTLIPSNLSFDAGKTYKIELSAKDYNNNLLNLEVKSLKGSSSTLSITDFIPFPNPFAPDGTTSKGITFGFQIAADADCTVNIYNIAGRLMRRITYHASPGYVSNIIWDGKDASGEIVPNGVYLYTFRAQDTSGNIFKKRGRIALLR